MQDAKMELRQWEVTEDDSGVDQSISEGCGLESSSTLFITSVLGLKWNKREDSLGLDFNFRNSTSTITTKREILSRVHQIFDPVGFTCPVTLQQKLLLQTIWLLRLGWDEKVPYEIEEKFQKWTKEVGILKEIWVPRQISLKEADGIQFHTFGDASQLAYAAVVFVRSVKAGDVRVQLSQAKSRVSPLKKGTIPRLELLACLIGSRLEKSTKEALNIVGVQTFCWSDSTTALAWIRRNDEWGTFVGNRVREILTHTEAENWNFVPGSLNPADLPSRGCTPTQLLESRWWEGPDWLKQSPVYWPSTEEITDEQEIMVERKKAVVALISWEVRGENSFSTKYLSYHKNVRVLTWIRRFTANCRSKKENRNLSRVITLPEMRKAELDLLRVIQGQSFPKDVTRVGGISVTKMEDGLFHVKSRLLNKEDSTFFKWQIILSSTSPLVEEMIFKIHRSHGHIGTQCIMGKIRERFWILQGRRTIRRVIRRCVKCKRYEAKSINVDPERRVRISAAFETTGVDLAGPLFLKNGKKAWVVLYICAVYRCVHLDLVSSLSTEAFLDSLERFVNFFGRPKTVYSDNGTNFVGAVNLFKTLNWKKIEKKSETRQIQWIFNPPTAAWWGGWWERLVRRTKDLLKRMLGNARLTEEKLRTCLSSVSAALNNRPLTTVTEDPEDLIPLTPAMFLRGTVSFRFPEAAEISANVLREDYHGTEKLYSELQNGFRKEYLSQLIQRSKEKKTPPPHIGDVVLVGADNKKRIECARILDLIPGKDGKPRVAKVKTVNGILVRPLQRLYPLEVLHLDDTTFGKPRYPKIDPIPILNVRESDIVPKQSHTPTPGKKTRCGRVIKTPLRFH